MDTPTETLIVERKDGVVTVTMNRPERKNAANGKMLRSYAPSSRRSKDRGEDRVMVLTGAGGAFCSGADLSDPDGPATDPTRSGLARMRRLGDVALAPASGDEADHRQGRRRGSRRGSFARTGVRPRRL